MDTHKNIVKLNVGGKTFETSTTTLAVAGQNSFFGTILDQNANLKAHNSDSYFIDRNPKYFAVLLDLLRTGELYIPSNIPEKLLYKEALFYGIHAQVRSAKWGPFDSNRLQFSQSFMGRALGNSTAIRASPRGGCCVAIGNMVYVYDWMLEEYPPINLDYERVNDLGWIDSELVVVSSCGGMALFSASTGGLKHRFQFTHNEEDKVKRYKVGALGINSDNNNIFCSCKGISNGNGIGVWDQVTGNQIDFFGDSDGWSFGEVNKLQWLHGTNCLMAASLYSSKDHSSICLLDFRQKKKVNTWSEVKRRVRDALAMEEANSMCVAKDNGVLGFMDLRTNWSAMWCSGPGFGNYWMPEQPCSLKLAAHEGQILMSVDDKILAFCGPDWQLTSKFQAPSTQRVSIRDISIGGDRLFVLHAKNNVFDIWETPSPPLPMVCA